MKLFIRLFILGVIVLLVAIWYNRGRNPHAGKAAEELTSAARQAGEFMKDQIGTSNLSAEEIKAELARTGKIVRLKAEQAGQAVADATADARLTTKVKARLVGDQNLAALDISVSSTAGVVTLSGTSSSAEKIRKAIQLTMDTDGVHKVVSTLQVKDAAGGK